MQRLLVHPSGRGLQLADGSPFFYLGDTAWELFHRCSREEADLYLRNRAAKGMNVIQAVALAELDGLGTPNVYGHFPLHNSDPSCPVEEYWQHVDWVVRRANELGLYVAFLPTWGDKWNPSWGRGPAIFTPQNAYAYGRWLGQRYRNFHLIWITGGDRALRHEDDLSIIRAMADGLRAGDEGAHLISFHPPGGTSSSRFVHPEPWLDFHMLQSGHSRERDSWAMLAADFEMLPRRPVINAEPGYEAHPNNFRGGDDGWLDQADVRRELYWAICAGAAGYTYGCHAVWQMFDHGRVPINSPRATWKESLDLPGAGQLALAGRFVLARPFYSRVPESWMLAWPHPSGPDALRACRSCDASFAFVYLPNCQRVKVNLQAIDADQVRASFFNPRTGDWVLAGTFKGRMEQLFQPPFDPYGRDWLLVLDDPRRDYPLAL